MKCIKKLEEPQQFMDWKTEHHNTLSEMYQDERVTGDVLWKFMDKKRAIFNKNRLKESLVKEQGYICCYCGTRIDISANTRIEHLEPKSQYKEKTYKYTNLLASCQGGTKDIIHKMKAEETLDSVAELYGVSVEHLEMVYVDTNYLENFRQVHDLENLQVGDRIVIFKLLDKKEQHCDNRKDNLTIDITPLQVDCADFFSYDKRKGLIRLTDNNQNTVNVLGLNNNPYLNENRLKQVNEAIRKLELLIKMYGQNRSLFLEKRNLLIQQLERFDETGKLRPWCFVGISILKGQ